MAEFAVRSLGVPADAVIAESDSLTTKENAAYVRRLLLERRLSVDKMIVVTSEFHMRRSLAIFAAVFAFPLPRHHPVDPHAAGAAAATAVEYVLAQPLVNGKWGTSDPAQTGGVRITGCGAGVGDPALFRWQEGHDLDAAGESARSGCLVS